MKVLRLSLYSLVLVGPFYAEAGAIMSGGEDSHVHQLVMELTDPTKVRLSCRSSRFHRPPLPAAAATFCCSRAGCSRLYPIAHAAFARRTHPPVGLPI